MEIEFLQTQQHYLEFVETRFRCVTKSILSLCMYVYCIHKNYACPVFAIRENFNNPKLHGRLRFYCLFRHTHLQCAYATLRMQIYFSLPSIRTVGTGISYVFRCHNFCMVYNNDKSQMEFQCRTHAISVYLKLKNR